MTCHSERSEAKNLLFFVAAAKFGLNSTEAELLQARKNTDGELRKSDEGFAA
jgi:hypothetical protein